MEMRCLHEGDRLLGKGDRCQGEGDRCQGEDDGDAQVKVTDARCARPACSFLSLGGSRVRNKCPFV